MAGTQVLLFTTKLRRGIFTGASRSPCELVTVAASTSSAVLWNFVGLWQVAVVHRNHCRSDVSRGNERASASAVTGATVAACPLGEPARPVFRALHPRRSRFRTHVQTDEKEMCAVREAVFRSTNKHPSSVHSSETKCAVGTP